VFVGHANKGPFNSKSIPTMEGVKCSKIFLVQNNPLFYDDYNDYTNQHSLQEKLSQPNLDTNVDEDEVVHEEIHLYFFKPIIRPWKEM
jgi:hypothetical protein